MKYILNIILLVILYPFQSSSCGDYRHLVEPTRIYSSKTPSHHLATSDGIDFKEGNTPRAKIQTQREKRDDEVLEPVPENILILLLIVLLIIASSIAFKIYSSIKRVKLQRDFASANGFEFKKKTNRDVHPYNLLHLFSKGIRRVIWNEMSKRSNQFELVMMDYRYSSGGEKGRTYRQTVVMLESKELDFPAFDIRPENIFHKIASVVGYKDIDFKEHPLFSKKYLLRGAEEEQIRNLMGTGLLEFLESQKGVSMECDGTRIIYYRYNKLVSKDNFQSFWEEANEALLLALPKTTS
ncbi:MAG: hypothetical protein HOL08_07415 [Opitutae bacterium]|jgi:hypothetical protein|nr:hypothetical protein [Opitutae bacterium]